jgi:uncharacterized protein
MKPSNYNIFVPYEPDNVYIGYNCVSGGLYVFNETQFRQVDKILKGEDGNSREAEVVKEKLVKGRFLIDEDWDELKILKLRNNITRYGGIGTAIVVAPTLFCSFDCPYCYVDRERVTMNRQTIDALKKFFDKKIKKSEKSEVCWTGGEPLLALEVIEELNDYFYNQCKKQDVIFSCSMVTNGYSLSPQIVARLKKCEIKKLQITLDGCREYHDRFRYRPGGGDTYDRIMDNIVMAYGEGLKITLRSNINKDNYEGIYKLIDELAEKILNKDDFVFAPCMVTDFKTSRGHCSCNVFSNREFSLLEPEILLYSAKKGFKIRLGILYTHRIHCGANTLPLHVIDAHGNVLKCWCNLGRADNNKIGIIKENGDILYTDYKVLTKWMSWDPFDIEDCVKCKVLPICMGGCMYHNIMGETDTIDIGCSHRRHNIEDIIKVMYLSQTRDISQLEGISFQKGQKIN